MHTTSRNHTNRRALTTASALVALGVVALGTQLRAESAGAEADAFKKDGVVQLGEFVTTGSRFTGRTVTDSPVPIDVIRGTELTQGGYTETAQMLQANIPSFNFPRPSLTDGTDHIRPATLRGLAPDQTLVLVNGKRYHTSALVNVNGTVGKGSVSTDLNSIPSGAIGQIEVLRDGASAQYGSDAIAGVINIILRKDLGWGTSLSWGATKQGDGRDLKLDAYNGSALGDKGTLFTALWVRDHSASDRSAADTRQQYFGTSASGAATAISGNYGSGTGLSASSGTLSAAEGTFNRHDYRFGDPASREKGVWFNGTYPLSSAIDFYFSGGGSFKRTNSAASFRRPGQDPTVRALYPNGFLPLIQAKVTDYNFLAGLNGHGTDWTWDLSTGYGSNSLVYRTANSENATLGTASPTSFNDGGLKFGQWTTNLDLTTERNAFSLVKPLKIAGGLENRYEKYTITAGDPDSYRNGGVKILDGPSAGTTPQAGAQGFPGFQPSDAGKHDRSSRAAYVDLEQQITDRWLVSAAGRFEHFTDFGDDTTGKVATRVQLLDTLAARGSASTGFRAPHLAQEWFSYTSSTLISGVLYDLRTLPATSAGGKALGATDLKPEKSFNKSFGLVWTPLPDLTTSVDYYNIHIKDRIVYSSNFTGTAVINILSGVGVTGVGGGRYFTNAVDTTTEGVDFSARYVKKTANYGKFTYTAGYNHNQTKATKVKQASATLAAITTTPLYDLTEITRLEKGQPRDNFNTSLTWDVGQFSFLAREVRYGQVSVVALSSATTAQIAAVTPGYKVSFAPAVPGSVGGTTTNQQVIQTFGAKWLTDFEAAYHVTKNLTVAIGANNLLNVYPDKNIASKVVNGTAYSGSDTTGITPYSSASPFGYTGAFYYGKVSLKF